MRALHPARPLPHVMLVSSSAETLDSLDGYFGARGVTVHRTRRIDKASGMMPPSSLALFLFPDDFQWIAVAKALSVLERDHPVVLPVVVTSTPQRFDEFARAEDEHGGLVVIPKPAWGWTLLDAIRGRIDAEGAYAARAR